jgi:hypothetical protein
VNGSDFRGKFVEGWLRIFLGMVQMVCTMAALLLLFTVGLQPITQGLALGSVAAMVLSRMLYGRKKAGR